jgi:CRP-like cAMP-binding protein
MYTDDILSSMKVYFIREEYHKNSRVYVDGDFDEYVYIIKSGSIAAVKAVTKIKNLKEKLVAIYENMPKYVILEKISKIIIKIGRGDVFVFTQHLSIKK